MELTRIHQLARALDYSEFEIEVMKEQADEQIETEASDICHNIMPRSLTAENGAKGLLLGEFHEIAEYITEDGDDQEIRVDVGWDTIKDIYAKIVAFYEA